MAARSVAFIADLKIDTLAFQVTPILISTVTSQLCVPTDLCAVRTRVRKPELMTTHSQDTRGRNGPPGHLSTLVFLQSKCTREMPPARDDWLFGDPGPTEGPALFTFNVTSSVLVAVEGLAANF
jgi:hypothetical protein